MLPEFIERSAILVPLPVSYTHLDVYKRQILFFGIALLMGVGFGIMFPAFNTLFVNLAPNNQRVTATSTYLTSWDVGIGIGMLTG